MSRFSDAIAETPPESGPPPLQRYPPCGDRVSRCVFCEESKGGQMRDGLPPGPWREFQLPERWVSEEEFPAQSREAGPRSVLPWRVPGGMLRGSAFET